MKKTAVIFLSVSVVALFSIILFKNSNDISIQANIQNKNGWSVVKVEGKELILSSGKRLKTSLFDLKYIGVLQTIDKAPFYILSGRSCSNCDENISIYIWSPDNGPMLSNGKQPRYSYPGKEKDYATNELIFENRMFYNCHSPYENSIIWVQRSLNDKNVWENSVFIVSVVSNQLHETKISKSTKIDEFVSGKGNCKELPGIETTSEP